MLLLMRFILLVFTRLFFVFRVIVVTWCDVCARSQNSEANSLRFSFFFHVLDKRTCQIVATSNTHLFVFGIF